jgi:hypothetical protein
MMDGAGIRRVRPSRIRLQQVVDSGGKLKSSPNSGDQLGAFLELFGRSLM